MGLLEQINNGLNRIVWGPVMLLFLLGIGLYFSVRTGFFQIRYFGRMCRETIGSLFEKKPKSKQGITPFQAVSTALAGTLGTGNIVGVSTAIVTGGPGAIFWMWVSSILGMMTKYAEVLLAVYYRKKNGKGEYIGGPMYYIQYGMGYKFPAILFALFCVAASFGIGNMTQSNAVSTALECSFGIPTWISGVILAVLVGIVIIGGIKRVGSLAEKLVPLMSFLYLGLAIFVLFFNRSQIPKAFEEIFQYALCPSSILGGSAGYLFMQGIRFGISRGVFSNEAGLGSAPIAHAAANAKSPAQQGMWGMFEVFFDTIVSCTITALVVLTSGDWLSGQNGSTLTLTAFSNVIGDSAQGLISICMVFFAFSSILGWAYYGEKCMEYLFHKKFAIFIYRCVFLGFMIWGAVQNLSLVWSVSDTLNGLMAIPNLIALVWLSPIVFQETKRYQSMIKTIKNERNL